MCGRYANVVTRPETRALFGIKESVQVHMLLREVGNRHNITSTDQVLAVITTPEGQLEAPGKSATRLLETRLREVGSR